MHMHSPVFNLFNLVIIVQIFIIIIFVIILVSHLPLFGLTSVVSLYNYILCIY